MRRAGRRPATWVGPVGRVSGSGRRARPEQASRVRAGESHGSEGPDAAECWPGSTGRGAVTLAVALVTCSRQALQMPTPCGCVASGRGIACAPRARPGPARAARRWGGSRRESRHRGQVVREWRCRRAGAARAQQVGGVGRGEGVQGEVGGRRGLARRVGRSGSGPVRAGASRSARVSMRLAQSPPSTCTAAVARASW